jgi:hypothetical protein
MDHSPHKILTVLPKSLTWAVEGLTARERLGLRGGPSLIQRRAVMLCPALGEGE